LSPFRTPSPVSSVKIHRVLTGSAVAIAAVVAGTLGAWSAGAAAQPAAIARPAGLVREASPVRSEPAQIPSVQSAGQQAGELDAFSASALSSASGKVLHAPHGKSKAAPTPRQIARRLLRHFHWSRRQFRYLDPLWNRESSWNVRAYNLYSGAYGIPQAVPGSKMSSAGQRWRTSAATQIRWGLRYIKDRYGSPRAAWEHELATGWY
jgi:hypothetical protein